jgi:drug/metabolite transporter (DMT)-like permease
MLLWVILAAVSVTLVTIALRSASVAFLLPFMQLIEWLLLSIYLLCRPQTHRLKHGEHVVRKWGWHITAISIFSTLGAFFQYHAMHMADPNYVIAVKRMDVLMTVMLAGFLLHEKNILRRFKGSLVAVAGVLVILFFG